MERTGRKRLNGGSTRERRSENKHNSTENVREKGERNKILRETIVACFTSLYFTIEKEREERNIKEPEEDHIQISHPERRKKIRFANNVRDVPFLWVKNLRRTGSFVLLLLVPSALH